MEFIVVPINAGETKILAVAGDYFELIDNVDPVDVTLFSTEGRQAIAKSAVQGAYFKTEFREVNIKSLTAQTVRICVAEKEAGVKRQSGSVTIPGTVTMTGTVAISNTPNVTVTNPSNGTFTNAAASVNAASVQLLPANTARRYLLVQNNSDTANLFVRVDGVAATPTTGVKVGPGGSYEVANWAPTGAITAISDAAGTPVVVVEG